ncbi:tetratricopeptide repeat protein [Chryseobacterium sp. RG1]|uniref:Tetratricopeptide repeat protein n=1 Tax=Chryseobacterium tagetis TaxID=2801334 RepID=A0ABS8A1Y8_9FLAO|nr:tetratricopeptide repeat protein [Chryseobacterium tagetis]MCA6067810.1 tetratricopeptide repeat protein [Chryseobacterium tagetis]
MEEIKDIREDNYQESINIAWEAYHANNIDEVESACLKMIEDYPEKANCHYLMGLVYHSRKNFQKAADEFLISIQNDKAGKNNGYAYYWLGLSYAERSWFTSDDGAVYIYDKAQSEAYHKLASESLHFPPHALLHFKYSVKGQDKIELLEKGIAHYPEMPDFYVLLAEHYKSQGMSNLQLGSLNRAVEKGIESASVQFNLGQYYLSGGNYDLSAIHFAQALKLNENTSCNSYINYYQGRCAELVGDKISAEQFYLAAYDQEINSQDSLFGFFGLFTLYCDLDNRQKIDELILNLNINHDLLCEGGRVSGGPVFLAEHAVDHIEISNFEQIMVKLGKLKLDRAKRLLNGKIWLLRYFVAGQLGKYQDQYKAVKNSMKFLNHYHYDFLYSLYAEALSQIISYKADTIIERNKLFDNLISDLGSWNELSTHIAYYANDLFKLFFDDQSYQKIIDLSSFFSKDQLSENDCLFRLAYAYAELDQNTKAEEMYQDYLLKNGDSTAVLNNLGNLFDSRGDYTGAIALYKRGLLIDSKHENLNSNLKVTMKKLSLANEKAAQEISLQQEYQSAVNLLKNENDFVLDKLAQFIDRIKNDAAFDNWKVPIPRYNFQKYLAVNKQVADSLLTQWLKKQYLVDTKERDDYNVIIYSINPYLREEINRIQKHKIPQKWVDGFVGLSADTLEAKGYFTLLTRAGALTDKYKVLFKRDLDELFFNYLLGHQKATIVLSGSLVELALIYHCEIKGITTISVQDGTKKKNKALYSTVLNELITFAEDQKFFGQDFTHLSNLSRIYRNFVHPGKELKDGIDSPKADLCFISTIEILKRIL